jgi:hypothetical protein
MGPTVTEPPAEFPPTILTRQRQRHPTAPPRGEITTTSRSDGTFPANKDSDGDGCEDWIEVVDLNGDRQANLSDVLLVARRAFNILPPDAISDPLFDINKDGSTALPSVNLADAVLAARNSNLVKTHALCPSEG